MMYALDTNILVYAHNVKSPYHASAKRFVEQVMNARNADGQLSVYFPAQILMEFLNVITWQRLEAPLPLPDAIQVVQDYRTTGITILYPQQTQLETLVDLLKTVTTRKISRSLHFLMRRTLYRERRYGCCCRNVC
jgi:uncharacterized protein